MIHDHQPDPNHEAVSEAARMAAVIVTVVETMVLVATKDPGRSQQHQERDARVLEETMARDKRSYVHALDPQWVETAPAMDLLRTWSASAPWRELDTVAEGVADRIEERLAALYPEAMHRYRDALDAGDYPSVAMARASQVLASAPHDVAAPATPHHGAQQDIKQAKPGMVIDAAQPRRSVAPAQRRSMVAPARRR